MVKNQDFENMPDSAPTSFGPNIFSMKHQFIPNKIIFSTQHSRLSYLSASLSRKYSAPTRTKIDLKVCKELRVSVKNKLGVKVYGFEINCPYCTEATLDAFAVEHS